ncbi:MAG: hypothetical protein JWR84_2093 [Caulobacter sp.]|nr:hypothetical protein [Caulobacter sp.]
MGSLLSMALLSGCAAYQPAPLPRAPPSAPDAADLSVASQADVLKAIQLSPMVIDLAAPMTPEQVAVLAVLTSPDLRAARAKAGVARAQVFEAGLLPDPTFSIGADFPLNDGTAVTAITAALGLDIGALQTRGTRVAQAERAADQARLDLAWAEWATASQARLLSIRLIDLDRQRVLGSEAVRRANDLLARTTRAAARGDLKADDLTVRRLAAADAIDRLRGLERDAATARGELAKLTGLAETTLPRMIAGTEIGHQAPSAGRLFELGRDGRLDLAALRVGYDSQDAAVRLAILEQYPKIGLTLTGARDTGNVQTFGPAIDITLPIWNRNRGAIAVQEATREQLRLEYQARLSDLRSDIDAALALLALAGRQRAELVVQLGPMRSQLAAVERAAKRGDIADSVADELRQSVLTRELTLAAIDQTIAETWAGLDLTIGIPRDRWL